MPRAAAIAVRGQTKEEEMITVSHGVNTLSADLAGRTVSEVRAMTAQALNHAASDKALVGGEEVDESYVLQQGDELDFAKASGDKGR